MTIEWIVVGLLVWIGYLLTRIFERLPRPVDRDRKREKEMENPTPDYPAFPAAQIARATVFLQEASDESMAEQKRWFTTERWRQITQNHDKPTGSDRQRMYNVAVAGVRWSEVQMRLRFMIEANLRVQRGEWSITQARFYSNGLGYFWDRVCEANKLVDDWCIRLTATEAEHAERHRLYTESQAERELARSEFIKAWKSEFNAISESPPSFTDYGDEHGWGENWTEHKKAQK